MTFAKDDQLNTDSVCVLLLEDDDLDAYLTGLALSGVMRVTKIVRARNGQEAIDMLAFGEVKPNVAIVDLKLPVMDGLEFLKAHREREMENLPLIVLTSSSDWLDNALSYSSGAKRVICKLDSHIDLGIVLEDAINFFCSSHL